MSKKKKDSLPLLQTGVGTILSSMAVSGFLLGYVTDTFFDTAPIFMLGFGFLGIIGGIMKAHRLMIKAPSNAEFESKTQRSRDKHPTIND